MEGTGTGRMAVLEKKGLYQAAGLLENYGIDSETDVSLLDQGDLRNLVSQGLKPMQLKKLEHWCEGVRARAEKTLPSSLNTPTAAALLSSEALNVLTLPAPCATVAESVSDTAGERDGEEDGAEEDDDYSENDLDIVLEQSGTADSAGAASGGTEAPAKKAKITLTEEEENCAKKFRPAASKIDKERKIPLRHVSGRGSSIKKQGARKHDVKPETMKQRLMDFPNQFLQVLGGQLYCGVCCTNVGSSKSDARQHCNTMQHTKNVQKKIAGTQRRVQLLKCITDYKGVVSSQADGQEPAGFKLPFGCMRESYAGMHLEID